ncbi:mechanosensitive ion channel family protein [Microbulbifer pacificus]|uniref:mechanosensitive ion channel family protein n=1 Tax=Microbulbifer pacificus TaxID=407164 RepID=UPI000CF39D57|nr:mechanosensitive ion channel family protein [Microbulbifer pacificus]
MLVQAQPPDSDKTDQLADALELAEVAPSSFPEILDAVTASILNIWTGFLGHTPFMIASLLMLLLTWVLATLVGRFTFRFARKTTQRLSFQHLIKRLAKIAVWVVGLLFTAMVLFPGLTPAKALGGLGLLSVAIGLAFKDIFENFFAGILILWRFPFEAGDVIKCENVCGRVEQVDVRNAAIRRATGELVIVPNLFLFKNPVEILTNRNKRRFTVIVGVGYGVDLAEAVKTIEQAVQSCKSVRDDEPIQIFPHAFGDSSMEIEITWWSGSTPLEERKSQGEVVAAVKRALDEAGMEIPFPQCTLAFSQPLVLERGKNSSS